MPPKHLIGELVLRHPLNSQSVPGLIICARRANSDPLDSGSALSDRYPWVYYVLLAGGRIEGPLFSAELQHVSSPPAR